MRQPTSVDVLLARYAAGRIIRAYTSYCRDHSVPTPSRMDIGIMSTQARNLVSGGYDERDIIAEALTIAGEFDLYHGHRGMTQLQRRVRQTTEDQRIAGHEERQAASSRLPSEVLEAIGAPLKAFTGARSDYDGTWRRRCVIDGCARTALFGLTRCGAHEP